jgi:diguanylate cyclase (GGDEF)-like protein
MSPRTRKPLQGFAVLRARRMRLETPATLLWSGVQVPHGLPLTFALSLFKLSPIMSPRGLANPCKGLLCCGLAACGSKSPQHSRNTRFVVCLVSCLELLNSTIPKTRFKTTPVGLFDLYSVVRDNLLGKSIAVHYVQQLNEADVPISTVLQMLKLNPRSRSLRRLLIVPYVVLVLALAGTIIALSYSTGRRTIETVTESLLVETSSRIGQAIDRHIMGPAAVLEAAFPEGVPVAPRLENEVANLRNRFWAATSLHRDPSDYVYYGNRNGQVFGLKRLEGSQAELRMKLDSSQPREFYRFDGVDGKPLLHLKETKLFDPRERPWYKAAINRDEQTWTSVYIDFSSGELIATRARRVLGADQTVEGVVATDVSLHTLNNFVANLKTSPNGVALILEPNGELIAASNTANVLVAADGSKRRVKADETGNPLVTLLAQKAQERLKVEQRAVGGIESATQKQQIQTKLSGRSLPFSFEADDGSMIYAAVSHFADSAGLSWTIIVAMPRSDFMGGVTENLVKTILLAVFAALIAIALGFRVLCWVSRDLSELSAAAERVGLGELDTPVGKSRAAEIESLSSSFERMQHRLTHDQLTGLANREAFSLRLERRTKAALKQMADTPTGIDVQANSFAVMFIDLNDFKKVNDQLGHAVGDQVLVETGRRLEALVGPNDLVARLSGDEFVVLIDSIRGQSELEKIRMNVFIGLGEVPECLTKTTLKTISLGSSVGHALFPDDGINAAMLLKKADRRMYRQKFSRRNERSISSASISGKKLERREAD